MRRIYKGTRLGGSLPVLRSIALENFKAYERLEELELRPLTVFCGPNAVGKSSVIQALLMMQQTVSQQREEVSGQLVTDGKDVSLGDWRDVLFGHDLGRNLSIELTVPLRGGKLDYHFWKEPVNLTLLLDYYTDTGGNQVKPGEWETFFRFRTAMPDLPRWRLAAKEDNGQELVTVDVREDWYPGHKAVDVTFGEHLKHSGRHFEGPEVDMLGIRGWSGETKHDGVTLTEWDDDCGVEELVGLVSRMLSEVSRNLRVRYVAPAREIPQRYYDMDKRSGTTGLRRRGQGDWKTDIAVWGYSSWVRRPSAPARGPSMMIPAYDPVVDVVNSWLSHLGLPEVHPVVEGRDLQITVLSQYANECSVPYTDTGYGVSQVLPILVEGCLAAQDEIVVLDQPELHLHPRVQTGIADFAIAVAECRQVQVLVETHSDHFVNRIVRRVVEGQISSDDVAVYFFTPTSDGPHVEMVEVDPTFGIKNWPEDFFEDYADEQEAIIRASLKRRAEEGRN